ncbi:MAG: hypothetical protein IPH11_11330 [Ignavibacteriales bacterium]|nr:hypothetical protein [Ignavibacteriales bacterium]
MRIVGITVLLNFDKSALAAEGSSTKSFTISSSSGIISMILSYTAKLVSFKLGIRSFAISK